MKKLFFFGDSITAGAWDGAGGWVGRLSREVINKTIQSQKHDQNSFECLPYNLGVRGNKVENILHRFEREIGERVTEDEDLSTIKIIFAIGVNDTCYSNELKRCVTSKEVFVGTLEKIIESALYITKDISFVGMCPVDEDFLDPMKWLPTYSYKNEFISEYDNIIRDVCMKHQVIFCPLYAGLRSIPEYKSLLSDGLHPNEKGHEVIYKTIKNVLFKNL